MIVVTVGTHEQPFDRMVGAVAALEVEEPMMVQYGSSRLPHGRGEWIDYMSFDELAERAAGARAFVCHAGVGSILLARRLGHRPIVVPRLHELGEHVDDHQLQLARRLDAAGIVTMVKDETQLAAALDMPEAAAAQATAATPLLTAASLTEDVRAALVGFGSLRRAA
jgi:UDP-N-acetylglucosamine transferase subunit ALG13